MKSGRSSCRPNSLLGLKRLSRNDAAAFHMPESLWARIVFDFLLAYRLRTINRGHLLGALDPALPRMVASHINVSASGANPERHIEAVAAAFEADKTYLALALAMARQVQSMSAPESKPVSCTKQESRFKE